jgi:hypothetical protein
LYEKNNSNHNVTRYISWTNPDQTNNLFRMTRTLTDGKNKLLPVVSVVILSQEFKSSSETVNNDEDTFMWHVSLCKYVYIYHGFTSTCVYKIYNNNNNNNNNMVNAFNNVTADIEYTYIYNNILITKTTKL